MDKQDLELNNMDKRDLELNNLLGLYSVKNNQAANILFSLYIEILKSISKS